MRPLWICLIASAAFVLLGTQRAQAWTSSAHTVSGSSRQVLGHIEQRSARPASTLLERCCFLLEVRESGHIHATYPGELGSDGSLASPEGYHQMNADWSGEEIISYRESGGRPILAEVFAGGGARVRADVWERGEWLLPDGRRLSCLVYHSTSPREFDSNFKDGWMKSESLLEFVQPKGTLDVYSGRLVSAYFGTHCGYGADHHFVNASKPAWGGMNQPYEWTFKSWTRARWLHAKTLVKSIPQSVPANVPQPGGFSWLGGANSEGIVVVAQYFPRTQLAAMAKRLAAEFPITSHGVNLLEDRE
jgi:hypothetical protein